MTTIIKSIGNSDIIPDATITIETMLLLCYPSFPLRSALATAAVVEQWQQQKQKGYSEQEYEKEWEQE